MDAYRGIIEVFQNPAIADSLSKFKARPNPGGVEELGKHRIVTDAGENPSPKDEQ